MTGRLILTWLTRTVLAVWGVLLAVILAVTVYATLIDRTLRR